MEAAIASQTTESDDKISSVFASIAATVKEKVQKMDGAYDKLSKTYKQCAQFYCEDPNKPADQVGGRIMKCILFIAKSETVVNEIQAAKRKEEERRATKNMQSFRQKPKIEDGADLSSKKSGHL